MFIADLINFAKEFDLDSGSFENDIIDSEDEESSGVALNGLLQRISASVKSPTQDKFLVQELEKDMQRMMKMFYLEMRVKG